MNAEFLEKNLVITVGMDGSTITYSIPPTRKGMDAMAFIGVPVVVVSSGKIVSVGQVSSATNDLMGGEDIAIKTTLEGNYGITYKPSTGEFTVIQ